MNEGEKSLVKAMEEGHLVEVLQADSTPGGRRYFLQYGEEGIKAALEEYGRHHGVPVPEYVPQGVDVAQGRVHGGENDLSEHPDHERRRYRRMAEKDLYIPESEDDPSTEEEEEKDKLCWSEEEEEEVKEAEDSQEPVFHPMEENQSEPDEDEWLCPVCENSPCKFLQAQEEMEKVVSIMAPETTNKAKRFECYRFMSRWLHGLLGTGNRIPLPECCKQGIADLFPAEDGNYVGFRHANT